MSIAAILLADERGADGQPVALYAWDDGTTLIEYEIAQMVAAGVRDIEVVLGDDADRIIPFITGDNVEPIINPSPADEASAIRVGTSAVPRGTRCAIIARLSGPRPAPFLTTLLSAHTDAGAQMTRPTFEGVPGEPIVVGERMLEALRNLRGSDALARLLAEPSLAAVPWHTDLVMARLGSESDCAVFRKRYGL